MHMSVRLWTPWIDVQRLSPHKDQYLEFIWFSSPLSTCHPEQTSSFVYLGCVNSPTEGNWSENHSACYLKTRASNCSLVILLCNSNFVSSKLFIHSFLKSFLLPGLSSHIQSIPCVIRPELAMLISNRLNCLYMRNSVSQNQSHFFFLVLNWFHSSSPFNQKLKDQSQEDMELWGTCANTCGQQGSQLPQLNRGACCAQSSQPVLP